jgi:hypothetical protein
VDVRQVIAYTFGAGLVANLAVLYFRLNQPGIDFAAFGGTFLKIFTIYSGPLGIVLAKIFSRNPSRIAFDAKSVLALTLVTAWNAAVVSVVCFETSQVTLFAYQINGALDILMVAIAFLTTALLSFYFNTQTDQGA